jgi:hypothetical protein
MMLKNVCPGKKCITSPYTLVGFDLTTHKFISPQAETIPLDHAVRDRIKRFLHTYILVPPLLS